MITVLIIEDEIKTARELKKNIEKIFDDIVVLEIIASVSDAIKWFKNNNEPDIVFSDIQLADGLSFEIYKEIDIKAPIIFCTAFDEYAIDAFKTSGIDYLLKPIDEDKLIQSITKYKSLKDTFTNLDSYNNDIKVLLNNFNLIEHKRTILVHYQDKIIPLKTENIAYAHYELGIVYLFTFEGKKYFINQTLDEIESSLNDVVFYRANRQFIINKAAVVSIENYFTRRLLVKLSVSTSEEIIVSKIKAPMFLKWLENV